MKKGNLCIFLLFVAINTCIGQLNQHTLSALDEYVEKACAQWQVPGMSMVVVKDGEVVYQKAYGVRALNGEDVDDQTIFCIGSTTKAMTAAAMAMLVDEGKVDWDDPVIDYLPEFQLSDPYMTRDLRVRDLFTHNTGMGNADVLWVWLELQTSQILERMRYLEPAYPLRGGYTYQNIMYAAAGRLVERVSGMSWSTFIGERILVPLGMQNTFPTRQLSLHQQNRSIPHYTVDDEIRKIADLDADQIAPAGAVWSCSEDMAKWLQFLLDGGTVGEQRLISERNFAELLKPQIIVPKEQFYPTHRLTRPHWTTYGLGWFQHDYHGRFVCFHTGSLPGTIAIAGMIPDEDLGVFLLANLDHAEVRHALMYKVFDVFAGDTRGRDWSSELFDLYADLRERREARQSENAAKRILDTQHDHPLEAYTGKYYHDYLGEVRISQDLGQLTLRIGSRETVMQHWHHETFHCKMTDWSGDTFVTFSTDATGRISMSALGFDFVRRNE